MGYSSFTDEQLSKAFGDGLGEYIEHNLKEAERNINIWKHDIKEYERKIESCRWLMERAKIEIDDLNSAKRRFEKLKKPSFRGL